MGACVSNHSHNKKASSVKVKQVSFDSTTKLDQKMMIHSSSSNGKLPVMDGHVAVKPQLPPSQSPAATYSDYGSKEETFFDSQAWLDSDCESDFMSVNGEFTPSRGNTPVHHSLTQATSRVNEPIIGSKHEPFPTPTHKKMSLLDLFKQSIRDNHNYDDEIDEPSNKDGEMGLKKDGLTPKREIPTGSMHGCFSSLLSVRSTGRQKKEALIPSPNLAPKPVVG